MSSKEVEAHLRCLQGLGDRVRQVVVKLLMVLVSVDVSSSKRLARLFTWAASCEVVVSASVAAMVRIGRLPICDLLAVQACSG